jgi:circadian clock protein KaiB
VNDAQGGVRTVLRLFVTGGTSRGRRAVVRVRDLCDRHLPGGYELDVIDVLERPELAERYRIVATPTLVRDQPSPRRRIVGDHSDANALRIALELSEEMRSTTGAD